MIDVHTEPREWDADAEGSDELADEDHRRPDSICLHPLTGSRVCGTCLTTPSRGGRSRAVG
jgi:hypothetical protein